MICDVSIGKRLSFVFGLIGVVILFLVSFFIF